MKKRKSICVFLHFFPENYIPLYVKLYIESLEKHFDEMLLVCNKRELNGDASSFIKRIPTLFVDNEGYDLGMFYKAIRCMQLSDYDTIACVNDSNFIFGDLQHVFDWARTQPVDFWGLIDSSQLPSMYVKESGYHIQSHFIVFREKAVELLSCFLESIDINTLLKETDSRILRKKVIAEWEVGVSQFLLSKGLTCKAFVDSDEYAKGLKTKKSKNISIVCYDKLIQNGYPVIKRRIISHHRIKLFSKRHQWKDLIRTYGNPEWDIERLIIDIAEVSSVFKRKSLLTRLITELKRFL